ncbi:fumarylacetoacetate hydrolase family protein [Sediminicola luteus]|uniref:Gentisate 1,2-dioxygenase n=1 Tax=Sediminicola luteus TaxID=319238 RepID=A0A2A4GD34_9FLAO|nr:fumarylacetoacetate hydrolase family protein [Sediminicola luteus]PCE65894.1 gentisate 1,2-dioxygenase [Sediminicola luteus]
MKLVSFRASGADRLGIVFPENKVADAQQWGAANGMDVPDSMLGLIDKGLEFRDSMSAKVKATAVDDNADYVYDYEAVKILAPMPKPARNIWGIGLNYTEHVAESARSLDTDNKLPQECIIFSKPTNTVIATGEAIKHNGNQTQQMDWEGELAVILGKGGFRVKAEDAMDLVYGYSIINDISARDNRRQGQWIVSKGMDTYAPMGPVLITPDEIEDPHNLQIITKVNGVEKQNGNTKNMLFRIPEIIQDISSVMSVDPADIIATGTPAGVGAGRDPQEWMWPGDEVEIIIEGIGSLKNPIVDDTY